MHSITHQMVVWSSTTIKWNKHHTASNGVHIFGIFSLIYSFRSCELPNVNHANTIFRSECKMIEVFFIFFRKEKKCYIYDSWLAFFIRRTQIADKYDISGRKNGMLLWMKCLKLQRCQPIGNIIILEEFCFAHFYYGEVTK